MNITIGFRPKLLDTPQKLFSRRPSGGCHRWRHGGYCCFAAGNGFCHRLRSDSAGWHLHGGDCRISISALGGTKVSIGGPTGALIAIRYGIYAKYGAENLAICTIMAGGMLVVTGLAGLGTMIKFIPYPVTSGFTSGIAVLIFSAQIKDFCGLAVNKVPSDFVDKMKVFIERGGTFQWPTLILAPG